MRGSRTRAAAAVVLLAAVVGLAGCGSSGAATAAGPAAASTGSGPSTAATMVCQQEAQDDIATELGVKPSEPPTSSYVDSLLTCRDTYPDGVLVLSVKDLPEVSAAAAYFAAMRATVDKPHDLQGVGQAAFSAPDGSVWVQKDAKVLRVDVGGLPDPFGSPPRPRTSVGIAVTAVIILCWKEG